MNLQHSKFTVEDVEVTLNLRCRCGHILRDHIEGGKCHFCSCELFEYAPETHRCKCCLVIKDENGYDDKKA